MCAGRRGSGEEGETREGAWARRRQGVFDPGEDDGGRGDREGCDKLHRRMGRDAERAIGVVDGTVVMAVRDGERAGEDQQGDAEEAKEQPPACGACIFPLYADHSASILADCQKR